MEGGQLSDRTPCLGTLSPPWPRSSTVIAGLGLDRGPGLEPKGLTLSPGLPQVSPVSVGPPSRFRGESCSFQGGCCPLCPPGTQRRAVQGLLEGGGG